MKNRFALSLMTAAALWVSPVMANVPVEDWQVGPINAKSSSGAVYCSMRNLYENGHRLVFARASTGANSIAVDFGKKALTAGAQYPVTLAVGPILRQMTAIAATTGVLIVQMGEDADFYEMLRVKNELAIGHERQDLRYNLAGTAAALEKLGECTDALGGGKAFAATQVPPAAKKTDDAAVRAAAAERAQLAEDFSLGNQSAVNSLKEELARLRDENTRLLRENHAVASRMEASDLGAAQNDLDRAAEFERRERALQIENLRLREQLESKQQPLAAVREAATGRADAAAEDRARKLEDENRRLREQLAATQAARAPDAVAAAPVAAVESAAIAAGRPAVRGDAVQPYAVSPVAAAFVPSAVTGVSLPQPAIAAPAGRRMLDTAPSARPLLDTVLEAGRVAGIARRDAGRAYWQTGGVFAMAEHLPAAADIETVSARYLDAAMQKCAGDAARQVSDVVRLDGALTVAGEVACMGAAAGDTLVGLAFLTRGADTVAVAYEGSALLAQDILTQRDAFLQSVAATPIR